MLQDYLTLNPLVRIAGAGYAVGLYNVNNVRNNLHDVHVIPVRLCNWIAGSCNGVCVTNRLKAGYAVGLYNVNNVRDYLHVVHIIPVRLCN